MDKSRIVQFDLARLLFCLVLFYLHFLEVQTAKYLGSDIMVKSSNVFNFAMVCLHGFFVISGWMNAKRYFENVSTWKEIKVFYLKRVLRFCQPIIFY